MAIELSEIQLLTEISEQKRRDADRAFVIDFMEKAIYAAAEQGAHMLRLSCAGEYDNAGVATRSVDMAGYTDYFEKKGFVRKKIGVLEVLSWDPSDTGK